MDLSVIENDPKEVKKYLQNFVPINYYRVLDDAYLYQIRAVLLHSVSHAELYNPVYAGLINDLTVTSGKNYATINTKLEVYADDFSALARKTETIRVEAANANASIVEIQQASAEQNRAQASVNQRLEASLDDIVVGGRNIMKNSDFSKGYRAWQDASITKHDHFIGTMYKISSTGIVGSLMGIYPLAEYQNMAMVEGTEYSISFYAYGSILLMDEIYLTSVSEAPIKLPSVVISTDLSERRHITFKAPTGGGGLGLIFGATATSEDAWFSISRVKVELGNRPTDWTPAPEDVDGYIAQVQSSIDTFKEVQVERNLATATSLERLDSRVKGNVASILTERNTRVDQHSAQAKINTELNSETEKNKASIKSTEETFTTRYEAHSKKLETLEAASSEGQGKIENLESVTANLSGVVATQGSTLTARLNNLNVGGRNLLRNSDFKLGVDNWGTATNKAAKSIFGNLVTVTNTGTTTNYYGLTPVDLFKTINIIKGKEYVLSFYAKGNVPLLNEIWITLGTHLPQKLGIAEIDENLAHRSEFVFTANESTDVASIIIGTSGYAKGTWFSVAATKLELGNKATDWTKAPEDTEGKLIEINSSIESFKEAQALENKATATRFDKMDTQYDESFGSINEKYDLVSNELGTTAQAILDLKSDTGTNSASIKELKETTSTNSGSIATMNSKLEVEYIPKVENIEANIKNAVKSTDVEYYLSTSTTAPVGGSWLTTAPPWTPSKYMFQRIKTTYVDGTFKHTPSDKGTNITGAKGDKGADGAAGVEGQGVDKIVEQYAVSTSKKDVPTSWGTTMPEWSYGLYVWTRSQITYKNPVEVAYTQPLVDSSWEAVNNLEIGGRNLLLKSNDLITTNSYMMNSYEITETLKEGETVTVTVWGILGNGKVNFAAYNSGGLNGVSIISITPELHTVSFPWKVMYENKDLRIYHFENDVVVNSTIYAVKLERGNKYTDWSPAPEDINKAIEGSIAITNKLSNDFGKLKAEASVLTTVGNKISGWKNLNDGTTSSFDILADKFSVGTATKMVKPFSIVGDDVVFNGKVSFNSVTGTEVIDKAINDINNLEIGGRNLLKDSSISVTASTYVLSDYPITDTLKEGEIVTITLWGSLGSSKEFFSVYNSGGSGGNALVEVKPRVYQITFPWKVYFTNNFLRIYHMPNAPAANSTINRIKLERGNKPTDWTPAPEDVEGMVDDIKNNIYYPNTTTIDGGKIKTNSIHADRIIANTITGGMINADRLSAITSNLGDITGGSIKIGSNFNVTTAGVLTASSGNFTGVVNATSGNFTGVINATSGSFKGAITASTININDRFKVDSSGNMTATSGTFTGVVNATSGTFKGNITGATGSFKGNLTGASGRFEGTVIANNIEGKVANIADLAVDTLQIADNAITVPMTVNGASTVTVKTSDTEVVSAKLDTDLGHVTANINCSVTALLIVLSSAGNGTFYASVNIYASIYVDGVAVESDTLVYSGVPTATQSATVSRSYSVGGTVSLVRMFEKSASKKTLSIRLRYTVSSPSYTTVSVSSLHNKLLAIASRK